MITSVKKIEKEGNGIAFASAEGKLGFEEAGYAEEEYFIKGTASTYEETGRKDKKVIHADNPYINRVLIRRPADEKKFNGDIYIEILNATAGFDIDRMWVLTAKEMMRKGAVYVGITSRPEMLDTLQRFDPVRYADLNWTVSYPHQADLSKVDPLVVPKHPDRETGLFWDMLTDLAAFIRKGGFDLPTEDQKIMLTGWSQSANYLVTYVRYFEEAEAVYDGFYAAGNIHMFVTPLNQDGYGKPADFHLTEIDHMTKPFIAVQTESENAHFKGYECRQEDSDSDDFKYRIYEFAGTTHDTKFSLLDYYKWHTSADKRMDEVDLTPKYDAVTLSPLDYPSEYEFAAALRMLADWVRYGKKPVHGERIELTEDHDNKVDDNGNALSGVRSPLLDVPVAVYHRDSRERRADGTVFDNPLFGYVEYFTKEQLKEKYGSRENYMNQLKASAKDMEDRGFLLPEDYEDYVREIAGRTDF